MKLQLKLSLYLVLGLLFMFPTAIKTNAQIYNISFATTGTTNTLDSVIAENLSQGISLTMPGSDTLHLVGTLGINELQMTNSNLQVYPNPMQEQAEISFYAQQSGNVQLSIYDISGRKVLQTNNNLLQGLQQYLISGLKQGIYFINVNADNYSYATKLLNLRSSQTEAKIEYLGTKETEPNYNKLKSLNATFNMAYNTGDTMYYKGYSNNCYNVITDVPTSSETITFTFVSSLPTLSTLVATFITDSSAVSGGNITSDGGCTITASGICYSLDTIPTISDSIIANGDSLGLFSANLTGLAPGTTYYVRTYATNSEGTAYGNQISFTTLADLPTLTTTTASAITSISAKSGGNIISDGGGTITARGVCWSLVQNPTIADSITIDSSGTGSFISSLTGLLSDTTYYVRAYATNSAGTAYGNQISFKTLTFLPAIPYNKVAYYSFDATPVGQSNQPVTTFTDSANIVIMFEGKAWEVGDSTHYGSSTSYILTSNPNYKYYSQIRADMKVIQSRGVKVLWNVDDATSWNTTTPFTTYNGTQLNATQFAAFVKTIIVDSLGLDGIALDVEHMGGTAANANYIALLEAFGAYFGPLSSNPTRTIYTAAIYDQPQACYAIGQSVTVASYMNFVMDMGYFENNTTRFNLWANYIGDAKTMIGVTLESNYNPLTSAEAAAAWEPTGGTKAGIMVYGANISKSYTDGVFGALQ